MKSASGAGVIAMSQPIAGRICPFCQSVVKPGEGSIRCSSCGTLHHAECWAENGGCTILGCGGTAIRVRSHAQTPMPDQEDEDTPEAAALDYPQDPYLMGMAYLHGRGVRRDPVQAAYWLLMAARRGHTNAQCELGIMYEKGIGVPRDHAEAARWYRKSASRGSVRAHNMLCLLNTSRKVERGEAADEEESLS